MTLLPRIRISRSNLYIYIIVPEAAQVKKSQPISIYYFYLKTYTLIDQIILLVIFYLVETIVPLSVKFVLR